MNESNPKNNTCASEIKGMIEAKLLRCGVTPDKADAEQIYHAAVYVMREMISKRRDMFKDRVRADDTRKVCYLCMEFLVGRSFKINAMNLGIYDELCAALSEMGTNFDEVFSNEIDPGLGNGGLGRLAACFMDALTSLGYNAGGYSLFYDKGLFKQRLLDGEQLELPDEWTEHGGAWLCPRRDKAVTVRFGGTIREKFEEGGIRIENIDCEEIRAVPYDLRVVGAENGAVNTIRLWKATESSGLFSDYMTQGNYLRSSEHVSRAAEITANLYPEDNHDEGKLLRLTQQYLLVSASLQSIIGDYLASHGTLDGFEDKIAIHINDTHPALCIPELMRILMDVYSYGWDRAWQIVTRTVTYTNHTVMPEALECWRTDLFKLKLPRIYTIVNEINRRFCADLWTLYPGDWDRISRMAIVSHGQVRMANLSVLGSHKVNGVSKLHSEILKKSVFRDFYAVTPDKFTNVTNGIAHGRWLIAANPGLTSLIRECIGDEFYKNPMMLSEFGKSAADPSVLARLGEVKRQNKVRFSEYSKKNFGMALDPDSIFDVQVKRMHEYKRQLLNVLKIIAMYNAIKDDPGCDIPAQTFIFGGKAAPGYYMAKQLIKVICALSTELEADPRTRGRLRVLFAEDYNVSLAEVLIPAADISEQISLAGKEASGTGNMKLMMNGAITLGTLDGANVEILDAVGDDNIYIFGMNSGEADDLWRNGYDSSKYYRTSERLRRAVDVFSSGLGGKDFKNIYDYLLGGSHMPADPFMCMADFDSYMYVSDRLLSDFGDREKINRKSLVNIASSGVFSAYESIRNYADDIWHIKPVRR